MDVAHPIDPDHKSSLFAGFAGSLLIHLAIFVVAGISMRGCQKAQMGDPGGQDFREVGLFAVDGSDAESPNSGEGVGQAIENNPSPDPPTEMPNNTVQTSAESLIPEEAPDIRQLMGQPAAESSNEDIGDPNVPSIIGTGLPIAGAERASRPAGGLIAPSGTVGQQGVATGELGPGQTAFMDIADSGSKFVYVIDVSASMGEANRLQVAISQLKASLRLLQPNQQFQVIFYSEERMRLRLRPERESYFATPVNVMQAVHAADRTQPQRGTEHKPALIEALSLEPDVIYFLTDGREPPLYPADLRDIRSIAGSTTIHVIEFGTGALLDRSTSWLEVLARQSGGQYKLVGISQ